MTDEALERALLLADSVLRAASALGWEFGDPRALRRKQGLPVEEERKQDRCVGGDKKKPEPPHGRLLVEGEQVAIRIEERLREERIEPTAAQLAREKREYGYHAPRKVSVPDRRAAPGAPGHVPHLGRARPAQLVRPQG